MNTMKDRPARGIAPQRAASPDRISIASRVSRPVHEALAASAKISGRSISEEVEQRLVDSVKSLDVISHLFGSNPIVIDLIKSLSQSLEKVRKIAANSGLDETAGRQALRFAFDHIGHVYFWTGEDEKKPQGCSDSMEKPPARIADMPPAAMAYEVAEWAMWWNNDAVREEFESGQMSNHWTGDGKETVTIRETHPVTQLSEKLRGDNRESNNAPFVGSEGDQS
jgi:hypothetical protein